jgi:hypothetical protein
MRASSLYAQGCAFNEPRHALANPQREARRAQHPGCVSLLTFFAQAKKVSRSPVGRVEAFALKNRSPKQELDSSLRWNDEQKAKALDSR